MGQPKIQIPDIPPGEKTPLVLHLVEINEQLIVVTQQQAEEIQLLKDEIARLKGHKPKPTIKPSKIGDASKDKNEIRYFKEAARI